MIIQMMTIIWLCLKWLIIWKKKYFDSTNLLPMLQFLPSCIDWTTAERNKITLYSWPAGCDLYTIIFSMSFAPFLGYKIYSQKSYHKTADKISSSFGREKWGNMLIRYKIAVYSQESCFRPQEGQTDPRHPRIIQMTTWSNIHVHETVGTYRVLSLLLQNL